MSNRHTIQKQVLEVTTSDPAAKLGFEREVRDMYYDTLLPRMETLFDQYAGPGSRIRAEKLEIRVTLPNVKSWQENLCNAVIRELETALRSAVQQDISGGRAADVGVDAGFVREPAHDGYEVLFHFVSGGTLPWYADQWTIKTLREFIRDGLNARRTWGSAYDPGSYLGRLVRLLAAQPVALERLISQFGAWVLEGFLSGTKELKIISDWLPRLPARKGNGDWQTVLSFVASGTFAVSESDPGRRKEKEIVLALLCTLPKEGIVKEWDNSPQFKADISALIGGDQGDFTLESLLSAVEQKAETRSPADNTRPTPPASKQAEEEGIFITNAGLVLLHPFLDPLFTGLRYWDGAQFVSREQHQRAVLLSQYLVVPQEEVPEHELLLNKILCGYDVDDTLPASLDTTEKERQEATNLLEAVMRHWTFNGRAVFTTIDNLRASFLHREGKLVRKASGNWLLKVEKKGYDIVMRDLPWGIGIIRHPWMTSMLNVEWG